MEKMTQGSLAANPPRIEEVKEPTFTKQDREKLRDLRAKDQAAKRDERLKKLFFPKEHPPLTAEEERQLEQLKATEAATKEKGNEKKFPTLKVIFLGAEVFLVFMLLSLLHSGRTVPRVTTPYSWGDTITAIGAVVAALCMLRGICRTIEKYEVLYTLRGILRLLFGVIVILIALASCQKALEYLPPSEAARALELLANPSRIWEMIMDFYKSVVVPWVTGV